ncbi:MAG: hypothetical protein ACQCN3_10475 [Candidatus Bathyarchaeia archaeon]|jgi:DNA-directed RNA polymerase specialized sigma24 family protein
MSESTSMEKKQFDQLIEKLDKISKLLALNLVKDYDKQKEKIIALSSFGFGVTEIANLLNTSVGTANQALIRARKEKAKETEELTRDSKDGSAQSAQNLSADAKDKSKDSKESVI